MSLNSGTNVKNAWKYEKFVNIIRFLIVFGIKFTTTDVVNSDAIASRENTTARYEEMPLNGMSDSEPSLETPSISSKPVHNNQFTTMGVVDSDTTVNYDDTSMKPEKMPLNQTDDLEPSDGKRKHLNQTTIEYFVKTTTRYAKLTLNRSRK